MPPVNVYLQLALILAVQLLTLWLIRHYKYRTGTGFVLLLGSVVLAFTPNFRLLLHPYEIIHTIITSFIFLIGIGLIMERSQYRRIKPTGLSHPPLRTSTMNLAPRFPADADMQQLLQLLHKEVGLPRRKTIHLETSINIDLGCNGARAKQFMDALKQDFAIDLANYDAYRNFDPYRYFQPAGYDVYFNQRARDRSNKVPLTVGMLYQAMKDRHWDTQTLENLDEYKT